MKNLNICTLKEVPVKKKVTPKKKGKKPSYIYSWFIKLFLLHSFYIQICSRYYLIFFEQLPRQTLGWLNGNTYFLTLKGLWQIKNRLWIWLWRSQNSDFQSQFSMSKIIRILPIFFFIEEYKIRSTTYINDSFCLPSFLKHFLNS